MLLTAPTGIAAYNIGGVTAHSAFCLPVEHKKTAAYVPLRAEELRMKFKDIVNVIIDEISMLSCHNFDFINKRLCEIKDTTSDPTVIFGGLSLIVLGDLFQLKPVHGCYIFDTRKPESYLWQKFEVSILITNQRQAEDKTWAEILNRITAINSRTLTPAYLTDEQIQESKPDNESETAGLAETLNLAQGSRLIC